MPTDPRAVTEYRIPAVDLRPGDLVNTSPGEDDWQEVLAVHRSADEVSGAHLQALATSLGGRYVLVQLTDLAPLDNDVFFSDGVAMTYGADGGDDAPVTDVISGEDGVRTYLYTKYELVTIRSTG